MKKNKMRIVIIVLCAILTVNTLTLSTFASNSQHWYTKRSGNCQPTLSCDETYISQYDGYYIDKKVTDSSKEKVIYLTFDAGYENGNVEKILNTLNENNVKGAFFVLSHPIINNTDLIKKMKETGHLICNHTTNHKDMTKLTSDEMAKNLTELETVYKEKTGYILDKYFRFPEGQFNEETMKTAQKLGYKTIFWSFAYCDWDNGKQPNAEKAKKLILDNTHNGAVILLHPTSATNAEILPDLIKAWREMGYRFGTLDELCK